MDDRIPIVADYLDKQVLDSSFTDGRIWQAMAVSERTFYRLKPEALIYQQKRAKERQIAIEGIKASEIKQALQQGLKSKSERVLILQKEVDECLKELYDPGTPNYSLQGQKLKQVGKMLTVMEKAKLRQVLRELQCEISKIEGDYAPTKAEFKHLLGTDWEEEYVRPSASTN